MNAPSTQHDAGGSPENEAILRELTEMCRDAIDEGGSFSSERAERLVRTLKMNGWERHAEGKKPLRDQLRDRVFEQLSGHSLPRRSELDGLLSKIQRMYESAQHYEMKSPAHDEPDQRNPRYQAQPPNTALQGGESP